MPLTRWLDKSGHPIPRHPELLVEVAADIKVLSRGDPAGSIKPGSTNTDQAVNQQHRPTERDGITWHQMSC